MKTGVVEYWSQYILDFRMRIADYCFKFFNLGNLGIFCILNSLFFKFSLRPLRLCGEKHFFNLGILGNLVHFRHFLFCGLVLTIRKSS